MGKRTKYQVKEIAQLTLNVSSKVIKNDTDQLTAHECSYLPKVSY